MTTTAQSDLADAPRLDEPAETPATSPEPAAYEHRFCIPTVDPLPPRPVIDSADW